MERTLHSRSLVYSSYTRAQLKPHIQARPFCNECPKGSGCHCGESPDAQFEWEFSGEDKTRSTVLIPEDRKIQFHPNYSVGTAAIRGTTPLLSSRHHFWELRMTSPMYGTDVMIGVATKDAKIDFYESAFVSALGIDNNSWGFSYQGYLHHGGGKPRIYGNNKWSEGSIVGVHLDRWRGTIEFYLNRKPMGIAFTDILPHLELYPVISSTAAKSSMRLICAQSYRCDLAFECVRALSKTRFSGPNGKLLFSSVLKAETVHAKTKNLLESLPPGLATFVDNNCWYLFGTRLKADEMKIRAFTESPKWVVLSTDDDEEEVKKSGKGKKKFKRAGSSRRQQTGKQSSEEDSDSDDGSSFLKNDSFEEKPPASSSSSSRAATSSWSVTSRALESDTRDAARCETAKNGDSARKRFVLSKQTKKN